MVRSSVFSVLRSILEYNAESNRNNGIVINFMTQTLPTQTLVTFEEFFEEVIGGWVGEPLQRPEQGE